MAARKRIVKKLPEFRMPPVKGEPEEQDLKKVKEQALKELEEKDKQLKQWYETELDKNLKKP